MEDGAGGLTWNPMDDSPIPDRLWDGMLALLGGTLAVAGAAVAVAGTLGWPRRAPAELTGTQLALLGAQALASVGAVAWSGRRLCRRYPGAVAVAFAAAVPAALALLVGIEWWDPREPHAGWGDLFLNGTALAALVAGPAAFVLRRGEER
jgi:hypothetical protein